MTSDQQALYYSILENPADLAPKLVYADWLEEFGSDRDRIHARYIRDQVAGHAKSVPLSLITKMKPGQFNTPSQYHGNVGYCKAGTSPAYSQIMHVETGIYFIFRYGFIYEVLCTITQFMKWGEKLALNNPIQRWYLTDRRPWCIQDVDEENVRFLRRAFKNIEPPIIWWYFGAIADPSFSQYPHWLPRHWIRHFDKSKSGDNTYRRFPTMEAANADLGVATYEEARYSLNKVLRGLR